MDKPTEAALRRKLARIQAERDRQVGSRKNPVKDELGRTIYNYGSKDAVAVSPPFRPKSVPMERRPIRKKDLTDL